MPSIKTLGKHSNESANSPAKPLRSTTTERNPKKMARELVMEQGAVSYRSNTTARKSLAARRPSAWQKNLITFEEENINPLPEKLLEMSDLAKVIEEIESKGSSTESEDLEDTKEEMKPELSLSMAEDKKILDFDISSIEISSSGEEGDREFPVTGESEMNFLDIFGKVPEMDEVSLDLLEAKEEEKQQRLEKPSHLATKPGTMADMGKFLDPVTGLSALALVEALDSLPGETSADEESVTEDEEQPQKLHVSLTDDISGDESEKSVESFELATDILQHPDISFDLFLESIKPKALEIAQEAGADKKTCMKEQQKLATETAVADFLDNLINRCVAKAEHGQHDAVLKKSLDKYKLMETLKSTWDLLEFERTKSKFLNKKIVNFFKRKGSFRPISADSPNAIQNNRANFLTSLNLLDEWLHKEEQTKALHASQLFVVQQQFEGKKYQSMQKVSKLEDLITTTFKRKNFDKLQIVIKKLLRQMSSIRNEISQVRFQLLLEQHQFSVLQMKLNQLEDLGNGLTVCQYESLQTETVAVSKKIEEHNNTLERLHRHFNDNLHKMAHAKEKQSIISSITVAQKQFLEEVVQKEKLLRQQIHQQKLQRNHLKHETNNLIHQAGLLANQVLLKDYDQTVERAEKLRQTNENLKKIIKDLNSKIDKLV